MGIGALGEDFQNADKLLATRLASATRAQLHSLCDTDDNVLARFFGIGVLEPTRPAQGHRGEPSCILFPNMGKVQQSLRSGNDSEAVRLLQEAVNGGLNLSSDRPGRGLLKHRALEKSTACSTF